MQEIISGMLAEYEAGKISRRNLVLALSTAVAAAPMAHASESTFTGAGLNHIAVRVTDIARTRAFYQKHLGLPLISESSSSLFLKLGNEFLTFFKNERPGLDHFCIAIQDFKPDAVVEELKRQGLPPRRPSGTNRIYFKDPDGLEVQLSEIGHGA